MRYVCFTLHNSDYIPCLKAIVEMFYKLCPKGTFTKTYITNDFLNRQREMFCRLLYSVIYLRREMWEQHAEDLGLAQVESVPSDFQQYIDKNFEMFLTDSFNAKPAGNSIYIDLETMYFSSIPTIYLA